MSTSLLTDPFWTPEAIPPPGQFVAVRDWLLSLRRHRWPIWRLRLAADLVCEIQPQKAGGVAFRGRAVCAADAGMADLKAKHYERPRWEVHFLVRGQAVSWEWKATGRGSSRDADPDYGCEVRARVLDAFQSRVFDAMPREFLLQPACLACGKALTDPVSMARLIGPDCADTTSQAGVILWNLCQDEPASPANVQHQLGV